MNRLCDFDAGFGGSYQVKDPVADIVCGNRAIAKEVKDIIKQKRQAS